MGGLPVIQIRSLLCRPIVHRLEVLLKCLEVLSDDETPVDLKWVH
jgi:hypothetical protein